MKERLFRFKQFAVRHSQSAMKVGVDGVLIGAWASPTDGRAVDVGCGCGLIALMLAQRNPGALIDAIDIDTPSVEEARSNASDSPWSDRIVVEERTFDSLLKISGAPLYDMIVSNPPFFNSGVCNPLTPRERCRHQASLSPQALVKNAPALLLRNGRLSLIAPADIAENLKELAAGSGMAVERICYVRDHLSSPVKRVMMEFSKIRGGSHEDEKTEGETEKIQEPEVAHMTLFDRPGDPTREYRALCRDFYLKF